jgi:hypothetical protein
MTFELHIDKENELSEEKPKGPWVRYDLRELSWVEYDDCQRRCMVFIEETRMWSINKIKLQRMILTLALQRIVTENSVEELDLISKIPSDIHANALYAFYNAHCLLTDDDISMLEEQVSMYNNIEKVGQIKPPYNKMIIVLDLLRHFGGLTLSDVTSLTKKEIDTLYVLARLGMTWQMSQGINAIYEPVENRPEDNPVFREDIARTMAAREAFMTNLGKRPENED